MISAELASQLAEIGLDFYRRGWAPGTSGNFSAVISRDPLRLAITTSGAHKGALSATDILVIDERGRAPAGTGRPSAEAELHLAVVRARGAGAVLHTHSVWSTILSDAAEGPGVEFEGYELLKGLEGVTTHLHREWLPIVENTQDWVAGAAELEKTLHRYPKAHGFIIRRHGLYSWGENLLQARRHIETLEFLLEVTERKRGKTWRV
jgi:methylthioribulose-1-phosphate dehydratase